MNHNEHLRCIQTIYGTGVAMGGGGARGHSLFISRSPPDRCNRCVRLKVYSLHINIQCSSVLKNALADIRIITLKIKL